MHSVLITPKSKIELQFITDLLKRLQISSRRLTIEEREDIGLAMMMKDVDRSKTVSKETIMKKLQA